MRASRWVVALLVFGGTAAAQPKHKDPKPAPVDIKDLKATMKVLRDGSGGTYVVDPRIGGHGSSRAWYGAGKALYEQTVIGGSRNGDAWQVSVWAPRIADLRPGTIARKTDGTFEKTCDGKDDAVLVELVGDKAKEVLDKYQFLTTATVRVPHFLARDDRGVYYYVDRLAKPYGGKGYRVHVGRKGALKELPLVDLAVDNSGEVFSTKTGDLRLVRITGVAEPNAKWIKGERRTDLIMLNLDINSPLIFKDLGLYKFTGNICDNI